VKQIEIFLNINREYLFLIFLSGRKKRL